MQSVIPADIMGFFFDIFSRFSLLYVFYIVFSGIRVILQCYDWPFGVLRGVGAVRLLWKIMVFFLLICCYLVLKSNFTVLWGYLINRFCLFF